MEFPSAMSPEALQQLMDNAPSDKENLSKTDAPYGGYTKEQMFDIVDEAKDALMDKFNDPMCHKVMAMFILDHFVEWHKEVSHKLVIHATKEGDPGLALTAMGWAQDLASLETARDLILGVGIGDNDFTQECTCCNDDDD